jgi:hypothetical protein
MVGMAAAESVCPYGDHQEQKDQCAQGAAGALAPPGVPDHAEAEALRDARHRSPGLRSDGRAHRVPWIIEMSSSGP